MKKITLLLLAISSLAITHLSAQEQTLENRVESIVFVIDGNTREPAIRRYVDIKEGDVFSSEEEMLRIAEREKQDLVNYRVFKNVTMDINELSRSEDTVNWRITYGVKDSWTLLPIPYPKYDSNRGFRIGLKTYYDNAFGTMTDAYLGLGMDIRTNDTTGKMEIGEWVINPAWRRIKLGTMYFDVDFTQRYSEEIYDGGTPAENYNYGYLQTTLSIGSIIDFFPTDWYYNFRPTFFFRYGYKNIGNPDNVRVEPFNFSWDHNGGWGRVDWVNNLRTGQNYNLGHSIRLVVDPDTNDFQVINDLNLTGTYYLPFALNFNYYGRAMAFASFNGRRSAVGSMLRGVADDSMSGDFGFVFNSTLGIRFWRLEGIWDAQIHPFFDVGMAIPESGFSPDRDIRYGGGFDLVLFLDALPSLVARATIGADLGQYNWNEWDKYEIIITSSLFY
ncbi:MAG: hypothetical protein DRZ90_05640 [Spirochaetes bacterium]|nr:MAG: hypothetical protein DRZ90_05640 [Spirochaetota bacterium]